MWFRFRDLQALIICAAALSLTGCSNLFGTSSYLDNALNTIRESALNSDQVNWSAVRKRCKELSDGAENPADFYPAINYALAALGDHHSFLLSADGSPVRQRHYSELGQGDKLPERAPQEVSPLITDEKLFSTAEGNIGRVVVGEFVGNQNAAKAFATSIQEQIKKISSPQPIGWIVDLRGNGGGNMWPMLAGIGPILGAGKIGYFGMRNGYTVPWFYENGAAGTVHGKNKKVSSRVDASIPDYPKETPVAVLIDRVTASSGEAVAVAFKGRRNTRFFGENSAGLSTGNQPFKLSDGATIWLTTSVDLDRDKHMYFSGVSPDETILGSPKEDQVAQAAVAWILTRIRTQANDQRRPITPLH